MNNKNTQEWRPSASIASLKQRAKCIEKIRQFFAERNVWEVETPCAAQHTVTDQHIDSIPLQTSPTYYLQTSPEFAMKRLLAAGSGAIYQICKAFRQEQSGRWHNPEFTMLEWYRPGFDHWQLMQEAEDLLSYVLNSKPAQRISYSDLFKNECSIDPLNTNTNELKSFALSNNLNDPGLKSVDEWLDFIFSHIIQPRCGKQQPLFIHSFPPSQAALARCKNGVAERFEIYINGIELANGFHELTDATEQFKRFQQDNINRKNQLKNTQDIDQRFIAALDHGLPACAGIAIGIDRLCAIQQEADHLNTLSFSWERA